MSRHRPRDGERVVLLRRDGVPAIRRRPRGVAAVPPALRETYARLRPFARRAALVVVILLVYGGLALGGWILVVEGAGLFRGAGAETVVLVGGTVVYGVLVASGWYVVHCGGISALRAAWRERRARRARPPIAVVPPPRGGGRTGS
jgi:hypothetical protein